MFQVLFGVNYSMRCFRFVSLIATPSIGKNGRCLSINEIVDLTFTRWYHVSEYCFDQGLMMLVTGTFGNVVRMLMPFVITDEQLERGLSIVEEGLDILQK
jgi:acetylornithine/succinyldiaminopimelate/putrescine aminotransferase